MDNNILVISVFMTEIIPWDSAFGPIVLLYFGPETILPIASFVAGIIGVIMMFWRYLFGVVKKSYGKLFNCESSVITELGGELKSDTQPPGSNL